MPSWSLFNSAILNKVYILSFLLLNLMLKKNNAQGSIEYLIIIAVILAISAVVVYFIAGSTGHSMSSANFAECKKTASQCKSSLIFSPNDSCIDCESTCVVGGKDIMTLAEGCDANGACGLCKQGKPKSIYKLEQKCGDGVVMGDEVCDSNSVDCSTLGDYESGTEAPCLSNCSGYNTLVCSPAHEVNCYDGVDNDGNGAADFADSNCLKLETIDSTGNANSYDTGGLSSLKVDASGVVHVAYRKNDSLTGDDVSHYELIYASRKGDNDWFKETVYANQSESLGTLALAFDKKGNPHIFFFAARFGTGSVYFNTSIITYLRHVWKEHGSWHSEIASTQPVYDPAVVFDSNNYPHVFVSVLDGGTYIDTNDEDKEANNIHLAHVWEDSSGWHKEIVDDNGYNVGHYISAVIDSDNNLYVSYTNHSYPLGSGAWRHDKCFLHYAYKPSSGDWVVKALEGPGSICGYGPEIDLDVSNKPHIVYDCGGNLKHASKGILSWGIQTLLASTDDFTPGWDIGFKIDKQHDNRFHIILDDRKNRDLVYSYKTSDWNKVIIDSAPYVAGQTSLDINQNGYAYVSYHAYDTDSLKFAKFRYYNP